MSNTHVGGVYLKIIDEVIDGSHNLFDEEGVEKALLEDLKKTWQHKLTERHVAQMPWDPPPSMNNSTATATSSAAALATKQEPTVKAEPPSYPEYAGGSVQSGGRSNIMPSTYDSSNAAASVRAAQNLQDKFGAAASPQISQLQAQAQLAQKANPGQSQMTTQQQYQQRLASTMQQQQQRVNAMQNVTPAQQRASVAGAQTDGAGDWDAAVAQRRSVSDESAKAADGTLRQRVEQMAVEMEGGGLMLPASEKKARATAQSRVPQRKAATGVAQYDGADDDIKNDPDEDAINSDLDDPDDDVLGETEDDPSTGELMLCTYDKVQRVKNKWKCTLKDGVLTTGGKEYVFGKAQGEFEW